MDGRWTLLVDCWNMPTPPKPLSATSEPSTPTPTTRPMSLVLRVVPAAAREGRLAGRVEVVDTGEIFAVKSADDLVDLIQRLAQSRDEDDALFFDTSNVSE